jgi:hypothetical protein
LANHLADGGQRLRDRLLCQEAGACPPFDGEERGRLRFRRAQAVAGDGYARSGPEQSRR